jgi:hypothetical protein
MRLILLLLLGILAQPAFAQLLTNGSFEQWDTSGSPPPFNWLEPTAWSSSNPVTEFSMAGTGRSDTARSGNYAVQVVTTNVQTTTMEYQPSILALGEADIFMLWATNRIAVDENSGGITATGQEGGIKGFYRFSSSSANDSAEIRCYLRKWKGPGLGYELIRRGTTRLGPTANWASFEVKMDSVGFGIADTFAVFVYSTKPSDPKQGGVLLLDSVTVTDVSTSVFDPSDFEFTLYPNPAAKIVRFQLATSGHYELRLFDMFGRMIQAGAGRGPQGEVTVDHLPAGMYVIELQTEQGTRRKNLLIHK